MNTIISGTKLKLLDLFCGAGGASMGYHLAGFDVTGVDLSPQKNYPFKFVQADALSYPLEEFDVIHASPPCHAHSVLRHASKEKAKQYTNLIPQTRQLLISSGLPYIIENVPGAPLIDPICLCGSHFGLGAGDRQLRRHRLFEASFRIEPIECAHVGEAIGVYGGGPVGRYTFGNGAKKDYYNRRGGYQGTIAEKREAMGIDWMNNKEINQAIPPKYTEYIGNQLNSTI